MFLYEKVIGMHIMEPMRPIIDYSVRKAINLGQCKEEHFEEYNRRWCLKYKNNPAYIQFLMTSILEFKNDIFMYIQKYYRYIMKMKSVEDIPVFKIR